MSSLGIGNKIRVVYSSYPGRQHNVSEGDVGYIAEIQEPGPRYYVIPTKKRLCSLVSDCLHRCQTKCGTWYGRFDVVTVNET